MHGVLAKTFDLGMVNLKLGLQNGYKVVIDRPQVKLHVCIHLVKNVILQNLSFFQGVIIVLEHYELINFRHLHELPACDRSEN